jgi:DNA-binding response OmpR family regulator
VASLLLVEDDNAIAQPLARALAHEGFDVKRVACGKDAISAAGQGVDVVLLDLMLPDIDGLDVCRALRDAYPNLAIIVLTGRTQETDIVVGLDSGADDYITKPFGVSELVARIRARLRPTASVRTARGVRVDVDARQAWHDENEVDLTPIEFDLLTLLVSNAGQVVTRGQIMKQVWNDDTDSASKTLDMHISTLRNKLDDDATQPAAHHNSSRNRIPIRDGLTDTTRLARRDFPDVLIRALAGDCTPQ